MPGTVIVQHMPPKFTQMFAEKLNESSKVEVKEAKSGDRIVTGRVLIAPGGYHMRVVRSGGTYVVECKEGEKINGHCPSVDVLFESVAANVGPNAVGVLLTGMGRDGAEQLLNMRRMGARTLAQDERTSVIFGMPKEAWKIGAAEDLVGIYDMTDRVIQLLKEMK
jgi:two-component system chemotaxis response regulator CheB